MGKMKARTLGVEEIEAKEKEASKKKATVKKEAQVTSEETNTETKTTEKKGKKPTVKKVRGIKYQKAKKLVTPGEKCTVAQAVAFIKKMKYTGFDESVEIHMNVEKTGLKGEVELPHSTGKTLRVAIVSDTVLNELENGKMNFDILITHPSFMPKLAKYAKVLGPKGLMPNPKAGTISPQPEEVAKKFLKGTLRWKTEGKFPLIHQMVGKISYEDKKLVENITAFITAVGKVNIHAAYLTSTMTPSVRIDLDSV